MRGRHWDHIHLAGGKTCLVLSGTHTRGKSDLPSPESLFVWNPNSRISPRVSRSPPTRAHTHTPDIFLLCAIPKLTGKRARVGMNLLTSQSKLFCNLGL